MFIRVLALTVVAATMAACSQQSDDNQQVSTTEADAVTPALAAETVAVAPVQVDHSLSPLPGLESEVPLITSKTIVSMQTTAGELIIEIYPDAAPNAAERFIELVNNGFFVNTPVSRVVEGFVAQFGINWREGFSQWQENNFDDDPTLFALDRGTLAFAKAGPNTNSTQVFINYGSNNHLAVPQYNFTTFGKVIKGMDVVDSFARVGDPSGGLNQGRLWADGEAYLEELTDKPTMIVSTTVIGQVP